MAPTVLGVGVPHTSPTVPDHLREPLKGMLDFMESDMNASPYDWDMFYVEPDMDFNLLLKKLKEKNWDLVMVGVGLRTGPALTPFFEKVVNAVHEELPKAKFAFNNSIKETLQACQRVMPS